MTQVEFVYNGAITLIQCNMNEKMKEIIKRFKEKANINNNNIFYTYDGKIGINEELKFEEIANNVDKNRKKMNILVYDTEIEIKEKDIIKSNNIICPECKENIKMEIKDYKINLYGCKNKHRIENILLNEFEETQNIDRLNIICDICKNNNKSISYNNIFYKCITCNKNICPLCKLNHNNNNHIIINYDDKDYICNKHNEKYISYCENCNKNLCGLCDGHKDHKRIFFADILPNKENLIKKNKELKFKIQMFDVQMKILISILNDVMNKMNIYYKINEDLINNYDNKNRNYEIINNINNIQNNSLEDLNKILECNSLADKFDNIFNIYKKINIDEINITYKKNDGENNIRLFGSDFVKGNKKNCKLIIEDKEEDLKEEINLLDKDSITIKLKGITNITNVSYMFYKCSSLTSLPDISKWNTSNIIDMSFMFYKCSSLLSLPDISKWNTSNVTNMNHMFSQCSSLTSLPNISKWNISNVTDMSYMFSDCSSLMSLPDISKWNTSNVIDMSNMFSDCSSLLSLPDISGWNTSNVIYMHFMFSECSSLLSLPNISRWNTSNVTNMNCMFSECSSLLSIPDISRWNYSNVINLDCMFSCCSSLSSIPDISKWNIPNTTSTKHMI